MIGASSTNKNPIILSFKKGLDHCIDLSPESIKETKINEPLINWHSYDGEEALHAINHSKGWATWASDNKLSHYSKLLKEKEGLNVLPASTAGLVGLLEMHKTMPFEGDRFVAILTGRKQSFQQKKSLSFNKKLKKIKWIEQLMEMPLFIARVLSIHLMEKLLMVW
eukprot:TRINITY_DN14520_c1_g1_i1.p1 TRINITY_DN14520_c1_g1~~TRINITY_DN14520_c1_g1_i1.p1  ORF type:complete len:183 (-),score=17.66 TRINITY_DN14520_c1_g1_i1:109-606(-)